MSKTEPEGESEPEVEHDQHAAAADALLRAGVPVGDVEDVVMMLHGDGGYCRVPAELVADEAEMARAECDRWRRVVETVEDAQAIARAEGVLLSEVLIHVRGACDHVTQTAPLDAEELVGPEER